MLVNEQLLLTLNQSLQMVAIAPCLLVIFYLLLTTRHPSLIITPCLYFVSLASSFANILFPAFLQYEKFTALKFTLTFWETLLPALSFLLVIQFAYNKIPAFLFWLIIVLPAFGGMPFIYGFVYEEKLCLDIDTCFSSYNALLFNNIFNSCVVFLLLTIMMPRLTDMLDTNKNNRRNKYALIIALILFNLILLSIDLGFIAESYTKERYIFAKTFTKIAFIYMVLTSIFRVFTEAFDTDHQYSSISWHRKPLAKKELEIVKTMEKLFNTDKIYADMEFCRTYLAEKLNISEHQISRIISQQYNKSFSEFANEYRVKDAKQKLLNTKDPVTVISFDTGFTSITSFNRVFKDYTGFSPSEFRQYNKK